jgi:hypothetical protein
MYNQISKKFVALGAAGVLAFLALAGAVIYGYLHNIYLLAMNMHSALTMEGVLRIIGIFAAPLGVIMGYL